MMQGLGDDEPKASTRKSQIRKLAERYSHSTLAYVLRTIEPLVILFVAVGLVVTAVYWYEIREEPKTSITPLEESLMPTFEFNLTGFTFPANLGDDKANFRFAVNLRFTNEEGQFATEKTIMPGLDTFWECAKNKKEKSNYVRATNTNGEESPAFDETRIKQWDPLIFRVNGKEVHSIRFEVFDVNRKNIWDTIGDTLKEILKNTLGAAISKMKGEIPEQMPLSLSKSLGGAADELESFLLKKLANADAEHLLFRGSTKLEGPKEYNVSGPGTKGKYQIKFELAS